MRRRYLSGTLVVLLVVVAAQASFAAAPAPRVFNVLDISRNDVQPINGFTFNRAPRAGDQFPIKDDLFRWAPGGKRGARLGLAEGIGTFVSVGSSTARAMFNVDAHLPGGTFLVQGFGPVEFEGPSRFTLPIVGGTGIYAGARGYVIVRDLGNGNSGKSNVEVHLLP